MVDFYLGYHLTLGAMWLMTVAVLFAMGVAGSMAVSGVGIIVATAVVLYFGLI